MPEGLKRPRVEIGLHIVDNIRLEENLSREKQPVSFKNQKCTILSGF